MANTLYNFVPEKWATKLDENLYNTSTMLKLVNTDYEGEIKNGGDTVQIRTPGTVSYGTYSGSVSYEDLSPTKTSMLIDQYKYFAFSVSDIEKAQSDIEIMENHVDEANESRRLTIDSHLLAHYANASSANQVDASDYEGGAADAGVPLSKDTIYKHFTALRRKLANSNAIPQGSMPWVVINPTVTDYLSQCPEFLNLEKLGEKAVKDGKVGRIAGFDIYETTNLTAVSSKYYCLAGTKKSITFAHQLSKVEDIRREGTFGTGVRGLDLYGSKVINPARLGVLIFAA